MGEEAAILAAVAANPRDDLPRLAYADWLDDHAADLPDPEAARLRAEFVRVQCEIARVEHLPSPDLQRYADLYRRQDALLTNHRRDLLGPLADALGPNDVVFDRGLVSELTLDGWAFEATAAAIAALRPLPEVRVTGAERALASLIECEYPGLVTRLDLQRADREARPLDFTQRLWLIELVHAAEGAVFDRLRELNCEGCGLGDGDLRLLARHPVGCPALTRLDLSGNELSDEGVRSLVGSPLWPRLTHLVLGANPLSDVAATVLADAAAESRLEYLNLRFTGLTSEGHRLLLRKFPRRTKLDLF
jgi:uncharacterized protein (TIGR02996 family)